MRHAKPPTKTPVTKKLLALWGLATLFVIFMLSLPYWATDEEGARRTLEAFNLTPVKVGGYDSFGCGLDLYSTQFTATNAAGKTVRGNVCYTPGASKSSIEIDAKTSGTP